MLNTQVVAQVAEEYADALHVQAADGDVCGSPDQGLKCCVGFFKKLCEEEDLERGVPASVRDAPALTATAALAQTLKLDPQAIAAKLAEQSTDNSSTETQADYPKIVEKALEMMLKAVTDAAKGQDNPQRVQKREADGKERDRSRSPMRDAT